jgi:branched-subunit amino acid transport protein
MNDWLIILGMGVVTFGIRLSFIAVLGKYEVPPLVMRGLNYVPSAVLSAIILPELLRPNNVFNLSLGNLRLLAGALAALVAWKSKNVLLTIAVGMAALWLLKLWV